MFDNLTPPNQRLCPGGPTATPMPSPISFELTSQPSIVPSFSYSYTFTKSSRCKFTIKFFFVKCYFQSSASFTIVDGRYRYKKGCGDTKRYQHSPKSKSSIGKRLYKYDTSKSKSSKGKRLRRLYKLGTSKSKSNTR